MSVAFKAKAAVVSPPKKAVRAAVYVIVMTAAIYLVVSTSRFDARDGIVNLQRERQHPLHCEGLPCPEQCSQWMIVNLEASVNAGRAKKRR